MSTLYIKNEAVADKARRLAKLTRQSITAAVSKALDESLEIFEPNEIIDRDQHEFRANVKPTDRPRKSASSDQTFYKVRAIRLPIPYLEIVDRPAEKPTPHQRNALLETYTLEQ